MPTPRRPVHDARDTRTACDARRVDFVVRSGAERAEKIRTYNYPQSRVTDHRVELTSYRLDGIMQGDIDEFVTALMAQDRAERLAATRDDRG